MRVLNKALYTHYIALATVPSWGLAYCPAVHAKERIWGVDWQNSEKFSRDDPLEAYKQRGAAKAEGI